MKHMTQRLFALLLVLCLFLSLAACAGHVQETGADTAPDAAAGKPTKPETTEGRETEPRPTEGIDDPVIPAATEDAAGGEGINAFGEYFAAEKSAANGLLLYGTAGASGEASARPADAPAPGDGKEADGDGTPGDDTILPGDPSPEPAPPVEPIPPAEPLKLTAAEWKDNDNWPFFTNLVNAGTIAFPSFGLDPRNRIKVTLTDEAGNPLPGEKVALLMEDYIAWQAQTDKDGVAFLFIDPAAVPTAIEVTDADGSYEWAYTLEKSTDSGDPQSPEQTRFYEEVTIVRQPVAPAQTGMQIMFIVDTTGSMGDEIAYLQKDFSAIADRVGSEGVTWSVNFYRDEGDEYVTRTNGFTSDVAEVQAKINAEYADGGGDTPEAVAEILTECLKGRTDWDEGSVKLAFLIFDAPPHGGKEAELQAAVSAAAAKGIRLIPVVASNADRETELFGRAAAILTGGTYVFLTDDSGIGDSHLEPIVGNYEVELLQDLIVRIIDENRP